MMGLAMAAAASSSRPTQHVGRAIQRLGQSRSLKRRQDLTALVREICPYDQETPADAVSYDRNEPLGMAVVVAIVGLVMWQQRTQMGKRRT